MSAIGFEGKKVLTTDILGIPKNHIDNKAITASIPDYVSKSELEDILKRLSQRPMYQHKCVNCGGTVELDYDKAIFICPYCGSHYALNTSRINDAL